MSRVDENKNATPWTQEVKDALALIDKLAETMATSSLSEAKLSYQGKANSIDIYMKR